MEVKLTIQQPPSAISLTLLADAEGRVRVCASRLSRNSMLEIDERTTRFLAQLIRLRDRFGVDEPGALSDPGLSTDEIPKVRGTGRLAPSGARETVDRFQAAISRALRATGELEEGDPIARLFEWRTHRGERGPELRVRLRPHVKARVEPSEELDNWLEPEPAREPAGRLEPDGHLSVSLALYNQGQPLERVVKALELATGARLDPVDHFTALALSVRVNSYLDLDRAWGVLSALSDHYRREIEPGGTSLNPKWAGIELRLLQGRLHHYSNEHHEAVSLFNDLSAEVGDGEGRVSLFAEIHLNAGRALTTLDRRSNSGRHANRFDLGSASNKLDDAQEHLELARRRYRQAGRLAGERAALAALATVEIRRWQLVGEPLDALDELERKARPYVELGRALRVEAMWRGRNGLCEQVWGQLERHLAGGSRDPSVQEEHLRRAESHLREAVDIQKRAGAVRHLAKSHVLLGFVKRDWVRHRRDHPEGVGAGPTSEPSKEFHAAARLYRRCRARWLSEVQRARAKDLEEDPAGDIRFVHDDEDPVIWLQPKSAA